MHQPARVVYRLGRGNKQLLQANYAGLLGAAALLQHISIRHAAALACTTGHVAGTQDKAAPTLMPIKKFELGRVAINLKGATNGLSVLLAGVIYSQDGGVEACSGQEVRF